MSMIIVSLVGNSVAACKSHDTAIKQLGEMLLGEASRNIQDALENGDARTAVKARTVYVELNEK